MRQYSTVLSRNLAYAKRLFIFSFAFLLSACATVDFIPILNPDAALESLIINYEIEQKGITCRGPNKIDCSSAAREIQKLLLANPDHTATQVLAASLFINTGRRIQAQVELDKVVRNYMPPLVALIMRTDLALGEGNVKLAKRLSDYSISLYAGEAKPYLQRASIEYIKGEYDKSLAYLSTSLRFGLDESIYYYHLGLINQAKHQVMQACQYYKRSLSLIPPNSALVTSRLASLQHLPNC